MKKILLIVFILIIFIHFSSCQRDDICVDGDTPLLIIGFFDFDDTTEFKSVPLLRIRSIDNDSILADDADEIASFGFTDRTNVADSIFIPLRLDNENTSFEFIMGSGINEMDEVIGTIDTLGFSYNLGEQFVSRACGFVANYNDLDTIRTPGNDDWIRRISIIENNVSNNPTSIHVKIFH